MCVCVCVCVCVGNLEFLDSNRILFADLSVINLLEFELSQEQALWSLQTQSLQSHQSSAVGGVLQVQLVKGLQHFVNIRNTRGANY